MQRLTSRAFMAPRIRIALFDFDGTLSTLRSGWEHVMRALMLEMLSGGQTPDEALRARVDTYIDESTGIQTIHQMKWLVAEMRNSGRQQSMSDNPWWYKAEYNRRLMETVTARRDDVSAGRIARETYIISGAEEFLKALCERNVRVFVASGTDHPDVVREAEVLGLSRYFDMIAGAPLGAESCSKDAVLRRIVEEEHLRGDEVAVVGDGKVEIALGCALGARTLGMATDETARFGVNEIKRARLINAGADCVAGDFNKISELLSFLGLDDRNAN